MNPERITAEKTSCILLKNKLGVPIGVILRNGHMVFYEVKEMNDDAIMDLFDKPKGTYADSDRK